MRPPPARRPAPGGGAARPGALPGALAGRRLALVALALLTACEPPTTKPPPADGRPPAAAPSAEDRAAYTEGLRAQTQDAAWAACLRVSNDDLRGDCLGAVVERWSAYDRCPELPTGRWRDECLFIASEQLGRRGDVEGAIRACRQSAYAAQCGDHVLGMYTMQHLQDDVPTVAAGFEQLRPLLVGPKAESQLWRSYFRNRLGRGLGLDPSGCPDTTCTYAAEMEVSALVRELQRRDGDAVFCAPTWAPPAWAAAEPLAGWVEAQRRRGCSGEANGLQGPNGEAAPPPIQPGRSAPLGAAPAPDPR